MKIKKFLIVGYGSIGKRHLNNVLKIYPESEVALYTRQRSPDVSGDVSVFNSLDQVACYKPNAAIICNPASEHVKLAEFLSDMGAHLLIEKPLSISSSEGQKLLSVKNDENVMMVGYTLRFSDSLNAFKSEIEEGHLGKPLFVQAAAGQHLPQWRPGSDYRKSVSAQPGLGGGVLLELSHELDYLIWLFGEVLSVHAELMNIGSLDIEVEDFADISLRMGKDTRLPVHVQLDFIHKRPVRYCKVVCERGELTWDAIENQVVRSTEKGMDIVFSCDDKDRNDMYLKELTSFVSMVDGGKGNCLTIESAVNVLNVIDSIRDSSARKEWVEICP